MANFDIISPTMARITDLSPVELEKLTKQCKYTNTSVSFVLRKHLANFRFKQGNPDLWAARTLELQEQLKTSILQEDQNGYWMRPGFIPHIKNIKINITNSIVYPVAKTPYKWVNKPEFKPYEYQIRSASELIKVKHGNISLATGAGKSYVLLMLVQQLGLDAVVITPSKSIFNELLKEFQHRLGKDVVGGYGDGKKDIKKPITIAIGRSITMLKEGTEAYEFFKNKKVLAADESHVFGANELDSACNGVLGEIPYRFFVSATQTRGDGTVKLLKSIIGQNVVELSIKDCIEQGYLCPLQFSIIPSISPSSLVKKDPAEIKRVHFLYNNIVADKIAKIANGNWTIKQESTLILVEELQQIYNLTRLLTVPFVYVHSGSKEEAEKWGLEVVNLQDQVDAFNDGRARVIMGTKAISTGTNMYPVHNSINWVGGGSEIVTKQGVVGRATRKLELSKYKDLHKPKKICTVYDFRIINNEYLDKQLKDRLEIYEETGGKITYY